MKNLDVKKINLTGILLITLNLKISDIGKIVVW